MVALAWIRILITAIARASTWMDATDKRQVWASYARLSQAV